MNTMKFTADHHFMIGEAHLGDGKPCQDHAQSGTYDDRAFAVVSDGCSSGGQTDIGSRLVTLATTKAIRNERMEQDNGPNIHAPYRIRAHQEALLAGARDLLGLDDTDLLATSLYTFIGPGGGYVSIHGDGIVAFRLENDTIIVHRFEWTGNMPYYPAYRNGTLDSFIEAHGSDLEAYRLTEECFVKTPDGEWRRFRTEEHTLKSGVDGIIIPIERATLEETKLLAVISDGITQVDGAEWTDVIDGLLSCKNHKGSFMKRRAQREIEARRKRGETPYDDIGIAAIHIERLHEHTNNEEDEP